MTRLALLLIGLLAVAANATEEKTYLWNYKADGAVRLAPISNGDWIYMGTSAGSVHALDERGTRAWKTGFSKRGGASAEIKRLSLVEGALVVELAEGAVHAIDTRTGKPLQPAERAAEITAKPAGTVSFEGRVVRVNASDSDDVVWSKTMEREVTAAALLDGKVVICLDDATVQAWGPAPPISDRTVDEL